MAQRAELGERVAVKGREPLFGEERDWGGGKICERHPSRKATGKWKNEESQGLKREKGERRWFKFIKTVKRGAQRLQLCSLIPGGARVGRINSQEQSGVWEVLGEKRFHCWKDIW